MANIFITGSADGLGKLAAQSLIEQGHQVTLHARNKQRADDAMQNITGAMGVLIADLSNIDETKQLATDANKLGTFDAVIHNAGVYQVGAETLFAVNSLAPYVLTCLMQKPGRLIYLSSGMHLGGHAKLDSFQDAKGITYSDTKLHVLLLAKAAARYWPQVYANAMDPGWVPTKMGGRGAPDNLQQGYETQVWLATSADRAAKVSGCYFFHLQQARYNREADDEALQDGFLKACENITGVAFPV